MHLKDTFNALADLYDATRPGYPDALFETLAEAIALEPGDWALEIGCGTGQATGGLARLGLQVTALDPGARLVCQARARLAAVSGVDFVVAPFEAWAPPAGIYRLVASAQAWHWVAPEIAFARAATALEPGGVLAVFGHVPCSPRPEMLERAAPIFARHAPELWVDPPENWYLPEGPVADLFHASGRFEPAAHRVFPWTWRKTIAQHLDFLRSRSDYQVIPAARREALLAELGPLFSPRGEDLAMAYETHLYWARRAG